MAVGEEAVGEEAVGEEVMGEEAMGEDRDREERDRRRQARPDSLAEADLATVLEALKAAERAGDSGEVERLTSLLHRIKAARLAAGKDES